MSTGHSEKACLLERPSGSSSGVDTRRLLAVDEQRSLMRRSTSSGAASLSGALNSVRRSILKSVGGSSLQSANSISSSPQRLAPTPRKSVSFHDLVHSSSVLHLALRSLSPKKQLPKSVEEHSKSAETLERRSPSPLPARLPNEQGSLRKSISNYVIAGKFDLTNCVDTLIKLIYLKSLVKWLGCVGVVIWAVVSLHGTRRDTDQAVCAEIR